MRFFLFFKRFFIGLSKLFYLFKKPLFRKMGVLFSIIFLILFLVLTPTFIFDKSKFMVDVSSLLSKNNSQKQVLTLWHIETFEGGSGNRAKYLEKVAQNFNKNQKNCFINVKTLTENQLFLNLEQKQYADIYSFGVGSGYLLSSFLQNLDKVNEVREDIQQYATINNRIYAYPYMFGGYVAISRQVDEQQNSSNKKIKELVFGNSSFINPAEALNLNGYDKIENSLCNYNLSSYEAYCDFVEHKSKTLIGTSRDYARIKNRELLGTISSCNYKYLGGYTDLIQYIGLNRNLNKTKNDLAKKFCNYLVSSNSQQMLRDIGLFSVLNTKIYDKADYSNFENIYINSQIKSINVFENISQIQSFKKSSLEKYFGI